MKNNLPTPNSSKFERAQSLVEFAISLLLILTILAGAVEISMALFEKVTMVNAAQEGALYASIYPALIYQPAVRARVKDAASDGLILTDSEIEIGVKGGGYCEGTNPTDGKPNQIQITINRPHRIFMPFASIFLGPQIPMSASANSTILQPTCP